MQSLGTGFGASVPLMTYTTAGKDVIAPQLRLDSDVEPVLATPAVPAAPAPASKYMTPKEAAAYLRISYSKFRKIATRIPRNEHTRRYHVDDLDDPKRWTKK